MKCEEIRSQLADYAVGGLRRRAGARVAEHVRQCADCRAEVTALQRTGELVSRLGLESAPLGAWEAIRFRINARPRAQTRPGWARGLAFAGLALAVLLVAIITFLPRPQADQPEALLMTQVEEEEMQVSLEEHLIAVWSAPLADTASVGLHLGAVEDDS